MLEYLNGAQFRAREDGLPILEGDYFFGSEESCRKFGKSFESVEFSQCLIVSPRRSHDGEPLKTWMILLNKDRRVVLMLDSQTGQTVEHLNLSPQEIAKKSNNQFLMQKDIPFATIPTACLNAVVAIEDPQFLKHNGVSYRGLARAIYTNLVAGKKAQGGSTITQQLVKNFFLTPEKTYSRKLKELALAVWLEGKFTKEQILETYLNIIYMGQDQSLQVRGFGAASQFYFNKELTQLNLPECALLAAILNSPGTYDPRTKPEKALQRRNLVIAKMAEHKLILDSEKDVAIKAALGVNKLQSSSQTAPYYLDAALEIMADMNIDPLGKNIYLNLNQITQKKAEQAVLEGLNKINKSGLQAVLISMDLKSNAVDALVAGSGFRGAPFNRAILGKRQIGSLAKPFVYLEALHQNKSPDLEIADDPLTIKYDKQVWKPQNYDRKSHGKVPLYVALANSYNLATVQLAQSLGWDKISGIYEELGLAKPPVIPSISLGATEYSPFEVFSAYARISRDGVALKPSLIDAIVTDTGEPVYSANYEQKPHEKYQDYLMLKKMLTATFEIGTAHHARTQGFGLAAAGKTGTTSDYKDAWFVGFTPSRLTLVWVGFDRAQASGLTGATGALPIWTQFMNSLGLPSDDFQIPEDAKGGVFTKGLTSKTLVWDGKDVEIWTRN